MNTSQPEFLNATHLAGKIDAYFNYIEGEYHLEQKLLKDETVMDIKVYDREPEPATFTGYMFFLGFHSRQQYDSYEQTGEFAPLITRGRLRIESTYEKKLHQQSPAGAIFALKSMGWNEKPETRPTAEALPNTLQVDIINCGPLPASSEKEVLL